MSWTLAIDDTDRDLTIQGGKFVRTNGSDEVRQRMGIALRHDLAEYYLTQLRGVPWDTILGGKTSQVDAGAIIRREILRVPGVLRINEFLLSFAGRQMTIAANVRVQRGPGDPADNVPLDLVI